MLYPHHANLGADGLNAAYAIMKGDERLRIASINLTTGKQAVQQQLAGLIVPVVAGLEVDA